MALVRSKKGEKLSVGTLDRRSNWNLAVVREVWGRWSIRHAYVAYLIRRLGLYIISLWGAFTVTFVFFHLIPGNPIQAFLESLQQQEVYGVSAGQEVVEHYKKLFGLEGNLLDQYLAYLYRVFVAHDLGPALINFPTDVTLIVARALPWTIGLLGISTVIAWTLGVFLGTVAGRFREGTAAQTLTNIAIALSHIPAYFVALVLLFIFAYRMAILPSSAAYQPSIMPELSLPFIWSLLRHGTLPALSIVIVVACNELIITRMLIVSTLGEDYLTLAEAKGLKSGHVLVQYALRNCYLPLVTAFGINLGRIISGNVLVERIFNYPGIGNLLVQAIAILDFNTIQGIIAMLIFAVLTANLIIDLLLPVLDARVKYW
jgi:peptide/nickel transport system permease protein